MKRHSSIQIYAESWLASMLQKLSQLTVALPSSRRAMHVVVRGIFVSLAGSTTCHVLSIKILGIFNNCKPNGIIQADHLALKWVVSFYNQRGTAEKHIKKGKYAFHWTRLSCKRFRDNEVRLQLHALAYNLATFLRCLDPPEAMVNWSLTSLQLKLTKIGARVVRHVRAIILQLAEVVVTGPMIRAVLAAIHRLRAPPAHDGGSGDDCAVTVTDRTRLSWARGAERY